MPRSLTFGRSLRSLHGLWSPGTPSKWRLTLKEEPEETKKEEEKTRNVQQWTKVVQGECYLCARGSYAAGETEVVEVEAAKKKKQTIVADD